MLLLHMMQCTEVNQTQPIYISRLACLLCITKYPTLTKKKKKNQEKKIRKKKKTHARSSEIMQERHKLVPHLVAVF